MEEKKRRTKAEKDEAKSQRKQKRAERKEARKTRKTKELDISIDTKRVDVDIERDSDGNLEVEWDGKHVDGKYIRTDEKVVLEVEINDKDKYLFEANGTNRKLPKGTLIRLAGNIVKTFLKRGWGKIKK